MGEVFDSKLYDYALISPSLGANPPDSLCIVSGYASHALATDHIQGLMAKNRSIKIDLIYGMAGVEGVKKIDHMGFVALHKKEEYPYDGSFDCRYIAKPKSIHAKVYVWCRKGVPIRAFLGSANYTNKGFKSNSRVEVLSECDPVTALDFFHKHREGSVLCHKASTESFVMTGEPVSTSVKNGDPVVHVEMDAQSPFYLRPYVDIPLRNTHGHFGIESGLNWGLDKTGQARLQNKKNPNGGRRDPDEAYIRFPKAFDCGFFPPYIPVQRGKSASEAQIRFSVATGDNKIFSCIRASGGYGKEIETPQDNAELGRWFRKKLGVPSGTMITDAIMKQYGREKVRFYKIGDDQFFLDF